MSEPAPRGEPSLRRVIAALAASAVVALAVLGLGVREDAADSREFDDPINTKSYKALYAQAEREFLAWHAARKGGAGAQPERAARVKDLLERAAHVYDELFGDIIHGYDDYTRKRAQINTMLDELAAAAADVGG